MPVALVAPASEGGNGRRNRRSPRAQRPGPVVQIFKATTNPAAAIDAQALVTKDTLTFTQLATLQAMLAGVQSLLEEARSAIAFRVLETDQPHRAAR